MLQTEHEHSLSSFYAGWDNYQRLLVATIASLTDEQLALRVEPLSRSVGMIVTHIVSCRAWWFHTRMGFGGAEFDAIALWDRWREMEVPTRSVAELVAGLEQTWALIQDVLDHHTSADLGLLFPHPDSVDRPLRSLQFIIWHVLEHDIHHGGEFSIILGAHGLQAVDL